MGKKKRNVQQPQPQPPQPPPPPQPPQQSPNLRYRNEHKKGYYSPSNSRDFQRYKSSRHNYRSISPSTSEDSFSDSSSGSSDEFDYFPSESLKQPDYYTETIDVVDPLQKEFCKWLYIYTPIEIDRIDEKINNAIKLRNKIEYYISRLDKDKKYSVLIKFKEDVDDNELTELRIEFRNTYSYVYFPYHRFDLILDYMNTNSFSDSKFVITGDCKLDIDSILRYKQIARDLVESNTNLGIHTTPEVIRDKIIRTYFNEHSINHVVNDKEDFMDKFGMYGIKLIKKYYNHTIQLT